MRNLTFRVFSHSTKEFLKMDIKQILDKPKKNNKEFLKIKKELQKRCKNFIRKCENAEYDTKDLPELDEYKKYANRLSWYKEIYEKERLIVEKIEQKRVQEFNLYHENFKKR